MINKILKGLRITKKKITSSIAFIPALIAIAFLLLSYLMISFDFSEAGKTFKSGLPWLSLKDASTARSICSTITGGVISLSVFSFSMVMILLNQAASQMSNRILSELISNRFQQTVLGFYIGTIVYSLAILSTIRDVDSGIHVPALSTYLLILLTIFDIFLFIYFLHFITQSVKYETVVNKIYTRTKLVIEKHNRQMQSGGSEVLQKTNFTLGAQKSAQFQGFDEKGLLALCVEHNLSLRFLYPVGSFVIEGIPLIEIPGEDNLPAEVKNDLHSFVFLDNKQEVSVSYVYGLRQLMEIAVRALSPGINDPRTAVIALHALSDLMVLKKYCRENLVNDEHGIARIGIQERSFEEDVEEYIMPIWDYGKEDRLMQQQFLHILLQLRQKLEHPVLDTLLQWVTASGRNTQAMH